MSTRDFMAGVQHGETIWHDVSKLPDQNGHEAMLALFNGRVEFINGERGTYAGVEVIMLGEENEPFWGSHTFMLFDGSTSDQTFKGEATRRAGPDRVSGIGTWQVVGGSGRLKDLQGGGTFTWSVDGDTYKAEFAP